MMASHQIIATTIRRRLWPRRLVALLSVAMAIAAPDSVPAGSLWLNLRLLVSQRGSQALQKAAPIKLGTELVSLRVTVTDRSGRVIEGLKKENFKIYEDEVEQSIHAFAEEDAPASIGVVFDISGSMRGSKIVQAKEALARFIEMSHEQDEYFLISFNSSVEPVLDATRDAQAVWDKLTHIQPYGETALYDAVYLDIEKVSHGKYPKRAIILISDGEENHSRHSFGDLRRRLEEADVTLYAIGIVENYRTPMRGGVGRLILDELASISGGKVFLPNGKAAMSEAFERVALELRRQYAIGYMPSNFVADGKWHRIKVTVTPLHEFPRPIVRSRKGYYALKNPIHHRGDAEP